jgi:hypothetical protein
VLLSDIDPVTQSKDYDEVLTTEGDKNIRFASDEIRHQVMSYFVLNCLKTDDDYKNYIMLSSVDSLLEYVRPWHHKRDKEEQCLYLPETLLNDFIKKLDLDAIRHIMVVNNHYGEMHESKVIEIRNSIKKNGKFTLSY